jgi:hypothetical protein
LAQDVEKRKAEPKTLHFLSLKQDIVGWLQVEKWGLKYGIFTQAKKLKKLLACSDCNKWLDGQCNNIETVTT